MENNLIEEELTNELEEIKDKCKEKGYANLFVIANSKSCFSNLNGSEKDLVLSLFLLSCKDKDYRALILKVAEAIKIKATFNELKGLVDKAFGTMDKEEKEEENGEQG